MIVSIKKMIDLSTVFFLCFRKSNKTIFCFLILNLIMYILNFILCASIVQKIDSIVESNQNLYKFDLSNAQSRVQFTLEFYNSADNDSLILFVILLSSF